MLLPAISIQAFHILPLPISNVISIITSMIDVMAAAVVLISVISTIKPVLCYTVRAAFGTGPVQKIIRSTSNARMQEGNRAQDLFSDLYRRKDRKDRKNFVGGLLLALELESANAILRAGMFTSLFAGSDVSALQINQLAGGGGFLFFIVVLSVRIAINQALRRFS
jgi:hypothetical protein